MRSASGHVVGLLLLAVVMLAIAGPSPASAQTTYYHYDLTVSASGSGRNFQSDHTTYYETASNNTATSSWSVTYPLVIVVDTEAQTIELQTPQGPTNGYIPSSSTSGIASYTGTISCDPASPCSASPNNSPYTCSYSEVDLSKYLAGGVLQPSWGYGPDHASYVSNSITFRATAGYLGGGPPLYCSDHNHGATPTPASALIFDSGSGGCGAPITLPLTHLGDANIYYHVPPVSDSHCAGPADFGFTGDINYNVTLTQTGAKLVPTHIVVKGWRSTGNIEWMSHFGPASAATPQTVFAIQEKAEVEVTVKNEGNAPTVGGEGLSVTVVNPDSGETTGPFDEDLVNMLRPGQSETIVRPNTRLLPPCYACQFFYPSIGRVRLSVKVTPRVVSAPSPVLLSRVLTVERPAADFKKPTISNPPSGFEAQGDIEPPPLPPGETIKPGPARPKLEVALLEVGGGAQAARARRPTCTWLAAAGGRFRRRPATGRTCATPIWLAVKSHRQHWSVRLRHRLPAGHYVMYLRALDSRGLYVPVFTAAAHTRIAFRVH